MKGIREYRLRAYFLLIGAILAGHISWCQGENNIWTFGRRYSLDFNTSPPLLRDNVLVNNQPPASLNYNHYNNSILVCDANGNIQFLVRINWSVDLNLPPEPLIFDRNMDPIPGTDLLNHMVSPGPENRNPPVVIPHPGDPNLYYIFYVRNFGLHYSLFDMSLNNGLGQIVPGQHNVLVSGYGTVLGHYLTTVKGCAGVWLVIRSRERNEYKSFLVDWDGLHTDPVISEVGLLPRENYNIPMGVLNASPNGRMLAIGCWNKVISNPGHPNTYSGGLELYDFQPCSGKLKNPRILDSGAYYGICFSPDNSKLYATRNDRYLPNRDYRAGYLFQFDLNQPSPQAIISSKTMIIDNPLANMATPIGCFDEECVLGDIKAGPDGRLYLLNYHPWVCGGTGMAFHIIKQPNNAGMACQPLINALYNTMNGMTYRVGNNHSPKGCPLPRPITTAPPKPDILPGQVYPVEVCFKDSVELLASSQGECYRWDNESTAPSRVITAPGTYHVGYFKNCSYQVDTYKVSFTLLPEVPEVVYGCDGAISLSVRNQTDDTTRYTYTLGNDQRNIEAVSSSGFTFTGLSAGTYELQIRTDSGCDTTLQVQLKAYPEVAVVTSPKDTTLRYGDTITLQALGANAYVWYPVYSLDTGIRSAPRAFPTQPTRYFVIGFNEYGCVDTGFVNVDIDYAMPDLVPNAFSPNGDGLNDVFKVQGITYQQLKMFRVFNRYGREVFYTLNPNQGWDGTVKGKPCDIGTYYYLIELVYPDGRIKTLKGDLTLVR